jgi:aconitate hydratase
VTLRDLFAAATLLKSKRVPSGLDFLLASPSRQMLEVLASTGALTDLIATGARLVEPDARVVSGELYSPPRVGISVRTCDPEPRVAGRRSAVVASAETLAYAIATGEVGDPRAFKRPVRVTVPRALPTDDVLIARKAERGEAAQLARAAKRDVAVPAGAAWKTAETMVLVEAAAFVGSTGRSGEATNGDSEIAVVCSTLDEVRDLSARASEISGSVRAVLAPYIPSAQVALFSAVGIAAIRVEAAAAKALKGQRTIALPAPSQWLERKATAVAVGGSKLPLTWLALGTERTWATGGRRVSGG